MCEVENKRTIFDSIGSVLKRGWEANDHPTISRTNVYVDQINRAQEKIEDTSISKKERKYYIRQKQRGLNGLDQADYENKAFISKTVFHIAIAAVAIYQTAKIINNK